MMHEQDIETTPEAETPAPEEEVEVSEAEGKKGSDKKRLKKLEAELADTQKKLEATEAALAEEKDKYLRMLAEYDNFRRRTAKEKETIYGDATADTVKGLLPVVDTLERAAAHLDDRAGHGRLHIAVPHLGVHLARAVGQIQIQILRSVSARALIRSAHQQKPFKPLILQKVTDFRLIQVQ